MANLYDSLRLVYNDIADDPFTASGARRIYAMLFNPVNGKALDWTQPIPSLTAFNGVQSTFAKVLPQDSVRTRHYQYSVLASGVSLPDTDDGFCYEVEYWAELVSGTQNRAVDLLIKVEKMSWAQASFREAYPVVVTIEGPSEVDEPRYLVADADHLIIGNDGLMTFVVRYTSRDGRLLNVLGPLNFGIQSPKPSVYLTDGEGNAAASSATSDIQLWTGYNPIVTQPSMGVYTIQVRLLAGYQSVLRGNLVLNLQARYDDRDIYTTKVIKVNKEAANWETFTSFSYDESTGRIGITAWIERNGKLILDASNVTAVLYDSSGTELFTLSINADAVTEAIGLFKGEVNAITLVPDMAYFVKVTSTDYNNIQRISGASPVTWD